MKKLAGKAKKALGRLLSKTGFKRPKVAENTWKNWLIEMLPENSVGVEIGVHEGDLSALIMDLVKPSKLHLIDPWRYEDSETYSEAWYGGTAKGGQSELDERYELVIDRFDSMINSGRIEVHRGNSEDIVESFTQQYFDWVYIDGNHLYE